MPEKTEVKPTIDLNRGVTKRIHPSGIAVCMYKDSPGVYLDTSGNVLPDQMAAEAGFPVEAYDKERKRRQKLEAAMQAINEEFGAIPKGQVILKVANYSVVHQGGGGFVLEDEDGTVLTKVAMDKTSAMKLARKMAASEKVEPDPDKEKDDGASA